MKSTGTRLNLRFALLRYSVARDTLWPMVDQGAIDLGMLALMLLAPANDQEMSEAEAKRVFELAAELGIEPEEEREAA